MNGSISDIAREEYRRNLKKRKEYNLDDAVDRILYKLDNTAKENVKKTYDLKNKGLYASKHLILKNRHDKSLTSILTGAK